MIRKTFLFLITVTGLLFSCQKDSGVEQSDIDELKARLDAIEKGKSIATITFEGTNMVLTYNTGEKVTMPMPAGLKGEKGDKGDPGTNGTNGTNGKDGTNGTNGKDGVNGTNGKDGVNGTNGTNGEDGVDGKDGVGIASIDYDATKGILTIKLTNGNVSNFQIVSSTDGSLSAVLLADTNGKMLIKAAYAGVVPYADVTYDANYNILNITSSVVNNGNILKSTEIIKKYSGSSLVGVDVKRYATKKEIKYDEIYLNYDPSDTTVNTNKGSYFTTYVGEGLYNLYVFQHQIADYYSGIVTGWTYKKYTVIKSATVLNIDNYYTCWKYNENIAYGIYEKLNVPGSTDNWYRAYRKLVKTGIANIGDLTSSKSYDIETLANGLIYKVTDPVKNRSIEFTYNSLKLVTDAVEKINSVEARKMKYDYDTSNRLVSVKEIKGGVTKEVVKNVYDAKGNPIEIYTYQGAIYTGPWSNFDPWSNPENPWQEELVRNAGLYLFAKIEYDSYKNFFGNTIGSIFPGLSGYNFVNAPKRIAYANECGFSSIDYKEFNELGYPKIMVGNAMFADSENEVGSYRLEFTLNYVQKN